MSRYQLLPPLSDAEYAALREDIRSAGVRVPIDVDENGEILDGHHRKAIADELGIECPERIVRDLPEFAKVDYALSVNLARRHLDQDGKRKLVRASLKRDPRLADREHARRCGVSHPFVAGLREAMEAAGQLETVTSRIGGDGRERQLPTQTAGAGLGGPAPAPNSSHRTGFSGEEPGESTATDTPDGPPAGTGDPAPSLGFSDPAGSSAATGEPAPDPGVAAPAEETDVPAASSPVSSDTAGAGAGDGPAPAAPCEKCGGEIGLAFAADGYTRCDECDPEGDHVAHDGEGCRGCRIVDETEPAYVLSFGENQHGLHLECGECDGIVAHLKPGGSLPEVLAAAREHHRSCS